MGGALYCAFVCFSLLSFTSCFGFDALGSEYPDSINVSTPLTNLKDDYSSYRLPTNLKPTEYNLTFTPDFDNSTFLGRTYIKFDVVSPTNQIVLNARFETLQAGSFNITPVQPISGPAVRIANTTIDKEHQMIWIQLEKTLQKQEGVFFGIFYKGILASDMMGFYLSTYNTTDSLGAQTTHKLAITQFEGTFARRAFPCFDEPSYRANFTIALARLSNQTSMSNMGLNYTTNIKDTNMVLDVYKTSPAMPTYLVAFGVGDLSSKSDNGTVRVFTRPDLIQDTGLALHVAQPILYSIGNFTKTPYPLKKMDIVSVPDFSAGAMENWGLTTFRGKYVLYNSNKNTKRDWFRVVSVIAHEFGHQWFGDLVTPQWWDYTWLNEAFATYFEYWTPDQLYPDFKMGWTIFVTEAVQEALDSDIDTGDTQRTRAMTSPVNTSDQIEDIFDYVIYEKGGSVLRMIENFLTTSVWRDGLHRYLESNAYKTGTPEKLFTALQAAADDSNIANASSVTSTLMSWTTQPGYPLVKLQKEQQSNYTLTQSPYELHNSSLRWSIPVTYTWQEQALFDPSKAARTLLNNTNQTVTINTTGWVILNIDQIGYFRVNYDDDNWAKISAQLKKNHSVIGANNRAQLLDDAFHLARTGHLNYSTVMSLTEYLPKETENAPWNSYFTNMRFLVNQFYNTSTGDNLMKYARNVMTSPFQALTANLTATTSSFLGATILLDAGQFSCDMQLPACEQLSSAAFQNWTKDPYSIPPETRQAVICTQLRLDSEGKWFQTVLDYFLNSDNSAEQLSLLRAMGCVSNQTNIKMYLDVVCDVTANYVRLQDRFIAFTNLLSRQAGVTPGLQYLVKNYNKVSQALGKKINSVFSTLGNTISQDGHISMVNTLLNDSSVDQGLKTKLQTLVLPQVMGRRSWAQTPQAQDLISWFDNKPVSSANAIIVNPVIFSISLIFVFWFL